MGSETTGQNYTMKWFKKRLDFDIEAKSLPSQSTEQTTEPTGNPTNFITFHNAYHSIEVVRRGADLIIDLASEMDFDLRNRNPVGRVEVIPRKKAVDTVLNVYPNDGEDVSVFRRQIYSDLILTGNAFMYWDGFHLYHIPSKHMQVVAGKNSKVAHYQYIPDQSLKYKTEEIIHIQDNNVSGKIIGSSRLISVRNTIAILKDMLTFQQNFFKNGAVPGLVLTTPNILGKKVKTRLVEYWQKQFSPKKGGRTPLVLDGGFKVNPVTTTTFKELDFEASIEKNEKKLLTALGVPAILLDGGNNANIAPNLKLFYITTVTPLVKKVASGLESFFAYDIKPDVTTVAALKPELRDQANYFSSLTNTGIITANESREQLRMDKHSDPQADELRIPANIAGSAANPSEGGRPENDGDKEDENT